MKYVLIVVLFLVIWPIQAKADLVSLVNEVRVERGLPALKVNPKLEEAALRRGKYVLARGVLDHYRWNSFYRGRGFCGTGENLAVYFPTDESIVEAWKHSPSHYKNLVTRFREVGVARVSGNFNGNWAEVVVMSFGIKCK